MPGYELLTIKEVKARYSGQLVQHSFNRQLDQEKWSAVSLDLHELLKIKVVNAQNSGQLVQHSIETKSDECPIQRPACSTLERSTVRPGKRPTVPLYLDELLTIKM